MAVVKNESIKENRRRYIDGLDAPVNLVSLSVMYARAHDSRGITVRLLRLNISVKIYILVISLI